MKFLSILAMAGIAPVGWLIAQTSGATTGQAATWITGGTVLTIAGAYYRFLRDRISKLEAALDKATAAAEQRADEDRKLLIPLLSRSVEAQAQYLGRHLARELDAE